MTALACLVLVAASTSVELEDEVYQIPPAEWKYVEVNLRQNPARVDASFEVQAGSETVRLALMTRAALENLRADLPHGLLAATAACAQTVLDNPGKIADARKLLDTFRGQPVRCDVFPIKPQFNFTLRLQAGYSSHVPQTQSPAEGQKWIVLARVTPTSAESIATMYDSLSSKVGGWPFLVGRNLPTRCRMCRTRTGSRWMFTFTNSTCVSASAGW